MGHLLFQKLFLAKNLRLICQTMTMTVLYHTAFIVFSLLHDLLLHKPGVWDSFSLSGSRRGCTDVEFTGKGNILVSKLIAFPCTFSINKGISTLDMSPALYLKALEACLWYNTFIVFCFLAFDQLSKDFCNCMSFPQAWANWFPWNRFNPMNIHLMWTH